MNIKPGDIISGSFFLKLVNDYKAYDQRQKEIIAKYQRQIENLKWEVENLTQCLQEAETLTPESRSTKDKNQRLTLREYHRQIVELKKENELLKQELSEERMNNFHSS